MKFRCPDPQALDGYLAKKGFEDRQQHLTDAKEFLLWGENGIANPTRFAKVYSSGKFVAGGVDAREFEQELLNKGLISEE